MSLLLELIRLSLSPAVYYIYPRPGSPPHSSPAAPVTRPSTDSGTPTATDDDSGSPLGPRVYQPRGIESLAETVLGVLNTASVFLKPYAGFRLLQHGYEIAGGQASFQETLANLPWTYLELAIGLFVSASIARGLGRYLNPEYTAFYDTWKLLKNGKPLTAEHKSILECFDYDFTFRPVDHTYETSGDETKTRSHSEHRPSEPQFMLKMLLSPSSVLYYLLATVVGIRAMYPGSTWAFKKMLGRHVLEGRKRVLVDFKGKRNKLLAADGNAIDTVFIDRRASSDADVGNTLVICCEGNGSFYEMGVMETAFRLNYSILGWNHPGYGASSGRPFPKAEQNAVDVVMQFALEKLKFVPERILFYGWSIGGFTSSHAASQHPGIRGIIIDASFDSMRELAPYHMPPVLGNVTRETVKRHLDIDVASQLKQYDGPVLLYRRLYDEMMSNRLNPVLPTNRGNFLLRALLVHRYPNLIDTRVLDRYLFECFDKTEAEGYIWEVGVNERECNEWLAAAAREFGLSMRERASWGQGLTATQKQKLTLHLVHYHLIDIDATHCTSIPLRDWREPWKGPALS